MRLYSDWSAVAAGMGVHASNNLNKTGFDKSIRRQWLPKYPICSRALANFLVSRQHLDITEALTAAIEGFFSSPAVGCVTSAPKNITGCLKNGGLENSKTTQNIEFKIVDAWIAQPIRQAPSPRHVLRLCHVKKYNPHTRKSIYT
jgi:hypothetical protein